MSKTARKKSHVHSSATPWMIGVFILFVLVIAGSLILNINPQSSKANGLMGIPVPITSADHVPEDSDPGPYASNPPAGGKHFEEHFYANFFQESDLSSLPSHPEGFLVHNLEHGYVIFWYNCQVSPSIDCADLKQTIQEVMDQAGSTKLIAFPWQSMDVPLALTSWGRLLKMDEADPSIMLEFVRSNRYQAPEPNGD